LPSQTRFLLLDKLSQIVVFYPFKVIHLYRSAIYYSPAACFPGSIYLFIHLNNDFMWKRFAIAAITCIIITFRTVAQIIQPLSIGIQSSPKRIFFYSMTRIVCLIYLYQKLNCCSLISGLRGAQVVLLNFRSLIHHI